MARTNKATQTQYQGAELETVVLVGTVSAFEYGIGEEAHCCVCGSLIKYAFITNMGIMGGDCLASITGDDSTRKEFKKLYNALDKFNDVSRVSVDSMESNGVAYLWMIMVKTRNSEKLYVASSTRKAGIAEMVAASWCERNDVQLWKS